MKNHSEAYHELENHVSSTIMLRELGTDAALNASEAGEWLNSSLGRETVDTEAYTEALKNRERERERERERGVSGVRVFIIQGCIGLTAHETYMNIWRSSLNKVKEHELEA